MFFFLFLTLIFFSLFIRSNWKLYESLKILQQDVLEAVITAKKGGEENREE